MECRTPVKQRDNRICLACGKHAKEVRRIESTKIKDKCLKYLLLKYGGLNVESGVLCRNCYNKLDNLHTKCLDFYNSCQENVKFSLKGGKQLSSSPATYSPTSSRSEKRRVNSVRKNQQNEYNNGDSSGGSRNTSPNNFPDVSTFKKKTSLSRTSMSCESSRFVSLKKSSPSVSLGITIVGGNAVGIFVHEVQSDSVAFEHTGLQCGDQILQYNGVDFTSVTAEFASTEISKSCLIAGMKVQYNPEKYYQIRDKPGDLFYMRAHFDRPAEKEGELSFYKDNVLMVVNTLYGGVAGCWFGWLVDDDCNKIKSGTIPSKERLENNFMPRSHSGSISLHVQDLNELKGTTRRGLGTARRNVSKDSREFSASDAPHTSESVPMLYDNGEGSDVRAAEKAKPRKSLFPLAFMGL